MDNNNNNSVSLASLELDFGVFDDLAMLEADPLMLFEPSLEADDVVGSVPRPYHAKRSHKKSRAGCTNCKRRKVKCSETRPACQACVLRKDTCVYPKPALAVASATAAAAAHSSQSPSSPEASQTGALSVSPQGRGSRRGRSPSVFSIDPADVIIKEPLFRPAEINDMTEMKLLWFYTTETFSSFSVDTRRSRIVDDALRVKVVEHAFQSPFLMQCLLGLSSLQLRSLGQPMTAKAAAEYSSKAFQGYRSAIQNAEPCDYPALLAASLLMCALSTEMFREEHKKRLCVVDWMTVWRGIGLIVELITPKSIQDSGLAVLFYRPPIDLEKTFRFIPNNLLFMVSSITPDDTDYPHQQVYYDALKYLGSLYMELQHGFSPILDLRVITFFTFIPKLFLPLGREERPRALIILAHYLTFTKLNSNVWWMQGLADREIDEICEVVGDQWDYLTAVPRKVRLATDKVEIARIIIDNHNWTPTEENSPPGTQELRGSSLALINDEGRQVAIKGNQWVYHNRDGSKKNDYTIANSPGAASDPKDVAKALMTVPRKISHPQPSHECAVVGDSPAASSDASTPLDMAAAREATRAWRNTLPTHVTSESFCPVTGFLSAASHRPPDIRPSSELTGLEGRDLSACIAGKFLSCGSESGQPAMMPCATGLSACTTPDSSSSSSAHSPAFATTSSNSSNINNNSYPSPQPNGAVCHDYGVDVSSASNNHIDKGTPEEKWALMGRRNAPLHESVRIPGDEDEQLGRELNL